MNQEKESIVERIASRELLLKKRWVKKYAPANRPGAWEYDKRTQLN